MSTTSVEELVRFGAKRYFELESIIAPMRIRDFGVNVMLAISSREAACMQLTNPAGTDRGMFQITERYHAEELSRMAGCPTSKLTDKDTWAASWRPDEDHTALDAGFVPTLSDGARFAYGLLRANVDSAKRHGLTKPNEIIRFAIAAYNGGSGGAWRGYQEGDVDKYTTGGEYSKNVLERWQFIRTHVEDLGWH